MSNVGKLTIQKKIVLKVYKIWPECLFLHCQQSVKNQKSWLYVMDIYLLFRPYLTNYTF